MDALGEADDGGEAHGRDQEPQRDALDQRLDANLLQYVHGKPRADQEQGQRETLLRRDDDPLCQSLRKRQAGIQDHGEHEQQDEPRDRDFAATALAEEGGGDECQRNDPQRAGAFDQRRRLKRLRPVGGAGSDDGTGVVNRDGRPFAELELGEPDQMPDRREDE